MSDTKKTRRNDGYSVVRRKDGRWEYAVTTGYNAAGNPTRKRGYAATRAEAAKMAQDVRAKLDMGRTVPSGRQSLGDYLDSWLARYGANWRPKTRDYYSLMVRAHIKPALGRIQLTKLSAADVQRLLNQKLEEGLSASTVRGIRATLRAALTRAWKHDLIGENVASKVDPPRIERADPLYLTIEEVGKLKTSLAGHPLENLVLFALATGARVGEVTGLRWDDVDLSAGVIRIRKQLQRSKGAGLQLRDVKSASSRRDLPMLQLARKAIERERARHMVDPLVAEEGNPLRLVFLNALGRPFDPKWIDKKLKELMVSAGVRPMSFHKFRHTAATLMLAEGVPITIVQQLLGHSSIHLTVGTYGHSVPDALRREMGKLDRLFEGHEG